MCPLQNSLDACALLASPPCTLLCVLGRFQSDTGAAITLFATFLIRDSPFKQDVTLGPSMSDLEEGNERTSSSAQESADQAEIAAQAPEEAGSWWSGFFRCYGPVGTFVPLREEETGPAIDPESPEGILNAKLDQLPC